MIKTGNWTIPDLIKYLVSVRSTLQPSEMKKLQVTPAFSHEQTAEQNSNEDGTLSQVPKFKASELYEPLDAFRDLGLPIIDWRGKNGKRKWKPNTEEGTPDTVYPPHVLTPSIPAKFLFDLGLRRYPPTGVILSIAAKSGPVGAAALRYFLKNYKKYEDYTVDAYANVTFVPALQRGEKKLATPLEVFSNPDWQSLGFHILDPALGQDAVNKLKIKEHPPTNQLVRLLETSPPATEAQAREWFGILSRRISGMCHVQSDGRVLISPRLPRF